MSSSALFERLLKSLRPTCADFGFKRRGQNFVKETVECWGVINFQRSRFSAPDTSLTINLGIAAKSILSYQERDVSVPPLAHECHWTGLRIGQLMPERRDRWWDLSDE